MSDKSFRVPEVKLQVSVTTKLPCPFSAMGMLQPANLQPPPMYGPFGSTIPPKHMASYAHFKINRPRFRQDANSNHKNSNQKNRWNGKQHAASDNQHTHSSQRYRAPRDFWCEPCDKDFQTQEMLSEHKSQHQKCNIEGCKFEGHELIVTKHISMQHSTGLFERLKNLDTPEDILRWREERKKRYPTKANIELRQQAQLERNKRGELLSDPKRRFGRNTDRRSFNNRQKDDNHADAIKKSRNKRRRKSDRKNEENVVSMCDDVNEKTIDDENETNNGLHRFKGTSHLTDYQKQKDRQPKNVLFNLLGMYGSDSESNDESLADSQSSNEIVTEVRKLAPSLTVAENDSESEGVPESVNPEFLNASASEDEDREDDIHNLPQEEAILKTVDTVQATNPTKIVAKKRNQISSNKRICKRTSNEIVTEVRKLGPSLTVSENDSKSEGVPESVNPEVLNTNANEDEDTEDGMHDLPQEEPILKTGDTVQATNPTKIIAKKRNQILNNKRICKRTTFMDLSKKYRNQNTMLEKLLQKDIRHERNVLLQCVRYVVQENFFGVGQKQAANSE